MKFKKIILLSISSALILNNTLPILTSVGENNTLKTNINSNQGFVYNKIKFETLTEEQIPTELRKYISTLKSNRGFKSIEKDGYVYIAIFAGKKNTGGYGINVTSVEDVEGRTNVFIKETTSSPNAIVIQTITYPYVVIRAKGITNKITLKYENPSNVGVPNNHFIGVNTSSGKVKKIVMSKRTFFVFITDKTGNERIFYTDNVKNISNLRIGMKITIKYALGAPKKIGNKSAMPLQRISKNNELH